MYFFKNEVELKMKRSLLISQGRHTLNTANKFIVAYQVNGTHDSEDEPPDLPFITGKSNKVKGRAPNTTDCKARHSTADGAESKVISIRSLLILKLLERFSLDCRKTKTKVNTLANQRAQ